MTDLGWMRMMGAESVGYHEHTVAGRADDRTENALEYYASRGETPMAWGGKGADVLGVGGEVDLEQWRALFGTGGPCHPLTGERLVACTRPGIELVISPHKSVAELGVIGRAEDMHQIVDTERDATMAYLDQVISAEGGRRGRTQARTPTDGLIWASSRHATTRAGDPQVHDHVLVANVVRMGDEHGGWKGLDTALLRDHLHAATAVGRMAAAAKAVELGYGIEADNGRSGRLGSWAVTGIPKEAWEVHANRSAQIDQAVGQDASYRSRSVAARATRERKVHEKVEDLVGRWRHELAAVGFPVPGLAQAVEQAGRSYEPPSPRVVEDIADVLLGPGGRLASQKSFSRADAIVAVAPCLHGLPLTYLDDAIGRVLSHDSAVALPPVGGARERAWAAAYVIEQERRIGDMAATLAERSVAALTPGQAAAAVNTTELARGSRLSERQTEVAKDLLTSGHAIDVVVGVAGGGKTSTLAAVRAGFESAGYQVLGAATSGQAAKSLEAGAGIRSRTLASLNWRLGHGKQSLTPGHVVVLDETGMIPDADLARLIGAVRESGARLLVVGDHRQLGAVGPGGALEALAARHPDHLWTLTENLRQRNLAERHALDDLRSGSVASAVDWYAAHGRVHVAADRDQAIDQMAEAWAAQVAEGRDALLLAYHRDAVGSLNQAARKRWEQLGRLSGPELEAPDGARYRAGDDVVTLAPGPNGAWVTSQRAVVRSVDPERGSLLAVTPGGKGLVMGPEDLGADKLAHGYAVTGHRSQGQTVDVTYALEDGGGRELAYVTMSRPRGESHVYVVASDLAQTTDRLTWAWGGERRDTWAIEQSPELAMAQLVSERSKLRASVPPDVSAQLEDTRRRLYLLEHDLSDLYQGSGRWATTAPGEAAKELGRATSEHERAARALQDDALGYWGRRKAKRELVTTMDRLGRATEGWEALGRPYAEAMEDQRHGLTDQVAKLEHGQRARAEFLAGHPEVTAQLDQLDREIARQEERDRQRHWELLVKKERERHIGLSHERDTGLGVDF